LKELPEFWNFRIRGNQLFEIVIIRI